MKQTKEELRAKIIRDMKLDKWMSMSGASFFVAALYAFVMGWGGLWIACLFGLNFLLWVNSLLLTKRDLAILEVSNEKE